MELAGKALEERTLTEDRSWIGITGGLVCFLSSAVGSFADKVTVIGDNESQILKMLAQLPKETNEV